MDGRHAKYGYTFLISFGAKGWSHAGHGTGVLDFDRSRRWFNDHYGWSQDVETRQTMIRNRKTNPESYQDNDINPVWAYATQYKDYRIYVAEEKTLSWFILCNPVSR